MPSTNKESSISPNSSFLGDFAFGVLGFVADFFFFIGFLVVGFFVGAFSQLIAYMIFI